MERRCEEQRKNGELFIGKGGQKPNTDNHKEH
jgi:hypothetical protein